MKTARISLIASLPFFLLFGIGVFAQDMYRAGQESVSAEDAMSAFAGTWVNASMSGLKHYPQKLVITSDGRMEQWLSTAYITARYINTIVAAWKDSEGSLYCTLDVKEFGVGFRYDQHLWKLSQLGKVLEWNHKITMGEEYPTEIDQHPDLTKFPRIYYGIWYRQ